MAERFLLQNGPLSSSPIVDLSGTVFLTTVHLFGSFEAQVDGAPLPRLRSRRGQWLLAILALRTPRPMERSWLAGTLWPDSTEENSLVSLRQTLLDLRHALGAERERLASPTARTLRFDSDGAFVDVIAFDAALKRGDPLSLREAVGLHCRPLLDDCCEEWALPERTHREQACLTALMTLADEALALGKPEDAAVYLRRVITADPFREDARRGLMTVLAQSGSPGEAVWVYRDLRLRLRGELHIEPAAETRAVYEQLRQKARQPLQLEVKAAPQPDLPLRPVIGLTGLLPKPLTELIGREHDIEEVGCRLFRSRLVTLTGIGGVGKTRLAIRVAEAWAEDQPEGVAFVDLARLTDAALAAQTIANALEVLENPTQPLIETLSEALREKRLLLLLDNCEHLLDACAGLVTRLLSECPLLVILTTSRQTLGVTGETIWAVEPLALPSSLERQSADAIGRSAAVRVFVDRAGAVRSGFVCTDANAAIVAEICCRLDGIPLALELAAARIRMLTPEQILNRLDDRFRLLSHGGSRSALPRQQTLRALLDWSYQLLSETERRLLCRCSVFSGGWTLEMAEAVCAENADEAAAMLDGLTSLVNQSLVQVTSEEGSERRYRFLETVRQYAREHLEADTGDKELSHRHRSWSLALVEQAQPHYRGPDQLFWLNRLEREHDNLRAALNFCRHDVRANEAYLTLAAGLWRFWMAHGYFAEGRDHLTSALAGAQTESTGEVKIKALNGAAAMAWHQGDLRAARLWMEQALGLARDAGCPSELGDSLHNLGNVVYSQRDLLATRPLWEEALAIRRQLGDRDGISASLNNLGCLAYNEGDLDRAEAVHLEALALVTDLSNRHQRRAALVGLGNIRGVEGDHYAARVFYEEALGLARELDDKECISGSLVGMGNAALRIGEPKKAVTYFEEALLIACDTGMKPAVLGVLESLAELRLMSGDVPQAVQLWAVVETNRTALDLPMLSSEMTLRIKGVTFAQSVLSGDDFTTAWAEGCALRLDQAVTAAQDWMSTAAGVKAERETVSA